MRVIGNNNIKPETVLKIWNSISWYDEMTDNPLLNSESIKEEFGCFGSDELWEEHIKRLSKRSLSLLYAKLIPLKKL